mmetsp:Transcript_15453/g.35351  ORF Transcript_15453/g.35351 Transcript_15453/m.35351 type:complete len:244 (+) Transcript_15453:1248-1979(+)
MHQALRGRVGLIGLARLRTDHVVYLFDHALGRPHGARDGFRLGPGRRRRAAVPSPPVSSSRPPVLAGRVLRLRFRLRLNHRVVTDNRVGVNHRAVTDNRVGFVLRARAVRRDTRLAIDEGGPAAAGPGLLLGLLLPPPGPHVVARVHGGGRQGLQPQHDLTRFRARRRRLLLLLIPPPGLGPADGRRGRVPGRVHRTRVVGARARQSHPHAGGVTPLLRRDVPGPAPPPGVGGRRLTLLLHLL